MSQKLRSKLKASLEKSIVKSSSPEDAGGKDVDSAQKDLQQPEREQNNNILPQAQDTAAGITTPVARLTLYMFQHDEQILSSFKTFLTKKGIRNSNASAIIRSCLRIMIQNPEHILEMYKEVMKEDGRRKRGKYTSAYRY